MLGERRRVGVVVDEHRQPEALGDQVPNRDVRDRQVDRGDREAALAVYRARDPEPDRGDVRTRGERLAQFALERREQHVELEAGGRLVAAKEHILIRVDDPDGHLRPPEISPDRSPHRWGLPRPQIKDSPKGMRY
jgi:hypothetical protein